MAKQLFIIAAVLFSLHARAQTGTVKGTIKTSDGEPAAFVNIAINSINKGVVANGKGEYEIKNIDPGTYTLKISFVGLETIELQVEVKANETTMVPEIVLKESANQLQEVTIGENKKLKPSSNQFNRMPIRYIEDIQSYGWLQKKQ